jgi:molybdate/tungstate transport system substrate-binding protein
VSKTAKIILFLSLPGFLAVAWSISHNSRCRSISGNEPKQLIIFHAGSLAVPFKEICRKFNDIHPEVKIIREAAGSRICARKISDLKRPCDIIASADYTVIDDLLIPEYADWNIKFASNEIVIAFVQNARQADQINKDNWYDILQDENVTFGRSDPNSDPCGYRTVLTMMLAEKFYNKSGLVNSMSAKDRQYIRPKEVDLLALLETGVLDYIFIYRSVTTQHNLRYVVLPDEINLKDAKMADLYKTVSVSITGKEPGTFITKQGGPIIYGVTIPNNAPNRKLALAFLTFLLDTDSGGAILERNGQGTVVPSATETYNKLPDSLKTFVLPVK